MARPGAVAPAGAQDFEAGSGLLVFGPGEKTKTFRVAVHDDSLEYPAAVSVDLTLETPGGGATLGRSEATLWIVKD